MNLYKGFEYLVYLESLEVVHITARSENCSIVDLEQVLMHFISEKNRSASAIVIGRVQATTRRR